MGTETRLQLSLREMGRLDALSERLRADYEPYHLLFELIRSTGIPLSTALRMRVKDLRYVSYVEYGGSGHLKKVGIPYRLQDEIVLFYDDYYDIAPAFLCKWDMDIPMSSDEFRRKVFSESIKAGFDEGLTILSLRKAYSRTNPFPLQTGNNEDIVLILNCVWKNTDGGE